MAVVSSAATAGGARLLGGLAAPAAQALFRKVTFRHKVARRVRKQVEFDCHWKTYRKWLKSISADELAAPPEKIHGPLAKRLDEALATACGWWGGIDDHLSRALRLVELTYPSLAAELGDSDAVYLSESWAQERSAAVRSMLYYLVGPEAAFSAVDFQAVLRRQSAARRAVRLKAFDVDETALTSYFDSIDTPEVNSGSVAVLLGDFGSGKSEAAENWYRGVIDGLDGDKNAPFPVWLSARTIFGQAVDHAIDGQVGRDWRSGRGASVVIDGLDETDAASAQGLLELARALVLSYDNVCVLMTARPGILSPTPAEENQVELLSEDESIKLIELVSGATSRMWRWTEGMRASVRRPFFALAAGIMLAREDAPSREADLIRWLAEDALWAGGERTAVTSESSVSVLKKLAVSLADANRDSLTFSERQVARTTRLVADGPDKTTYFSLPIFQQWFAAQAILDGDVSAEIVVASPAKFGRWRWAAAVAASSAVDPDTIDSLVSVWLAGNPGAGAWILNEAFGKHRMWQTESGEKPDPMTHGHRFLFALRTWSDALGPLRERLLPEPVVRGPVELGVSVSDFALNFAFFREETEIDNVRNIAPGTVSLFPERDTEWDLWIGGLIPACNAWNWLQVRDAIAGKTLDKLSKDSFLGGADGIWAQERRFDLARRLDLGSLYRDHLPTDQLLRRIIELRDFLGENNGDYFKINRSIDYKYSDLDEIAQWIKDSGCTTLDQKLPLPDRKLTETGFVWSQYSPQRLMEFEAEVYARACEAYDEAMNHSFSRFSWSMPSSALAPFGVVLEVSFEEGMRLGNIPGLRSMRVPLSLISDIVPADRDQIWSHSKRAVITRADTSFEQFQESYSSTFELIHSWLVDQGRETTGSIGWSSSGADEMAEVRPASSVAAKWLWRDLKNIGLGHGTFPQLR